MSKKLASEFIGTFALVFAGPGAVIVNGISQGTIGHVGIALTFGLVIMVMIYALGDVSGCHINPAVTIGFWAAKRFSGDMAWRYIAAQCSGAIVASLLWHFLYPRYAGLGVTHPTGAASHSFVLEIVLTFFLMFVILSVSTGAKEKGITAGIAIGATIALDALFGGPISGASMNPARSLGPALVNRDFADLWIYLLAPVIGAALAVAAYCMVREQCETVPPKI